MARATAPYFKVIYEGVDITEDITPDVIEIEYSDVIEGETDEIVITLDDMSGKWKGEWRSRNGDTIELQLGYSDSSLLDCGTYQIDEVNFSGQPDVVEISAVSIDVNSDLKDKRTEAYENQSIKQIAQAIADRNGMQLNNFFGTFSTNALVEYRTKVLDTKIPRATQDRESDLAFLNRLADKYGVSFSTKGNSIHFLVRYDMFLVPKTNDVVYRGDDGTEDYYQQEKEEEELETVVLKSYDLKDSAEAVTGGIDVVYHNDEQNRIYKYGINSSYLLKSYGMNQVEFLSEKHNINEYKRFTLYEDVSSEAEAEIVADAHWLRMAAKKVEGTMEMEGHPGLIAGTSFQVAGLKSLDGKYFIKESKHKITRGAGYTTSVEVSLIDA